MGRRGCWEAEAEWGDAGRPGLAPRRTAPGESGAPREMRAHTGPGRGEHAASPSHTREEPSGSRLVDMRFGSSVARRIVAGDSPASGSYSGSGCGVIGSSSVDAPCDGGSAITGDGSATRPPSLLVPSAEDSDPGAGSSVSEPFRSIPLPSFFHSSFQSHNTHKEKEKKPKLHTSLLCDIFSAFDAGNTTTHPCISVSKSVSICQLQQQKKGKRTQKFLSCFVLCFQDSSNQTKRRTTTEMLSLLPSMKA